MVGMMTCFAFLELEKKDRKKNQRRQEKRNKEQIHREEKGIWTAEKDYEDKGIVDWDDAFHKNRKQVFYMSRIKTREETEEKRRETNAQEIKERGLYYASGNMRMNEKISLHAERKRGSLNMEDCTR